MRLHIVRLPPVIIKYKSLEFFHLSQKKMFTVPVLVRFAIRRVILAAKFASERLFSWKKINVQSKQFQKWSKTNQYDSSCAVSAPSVCALSCHRLCTVAEFCLCWHDSACESKFLFSHSLNFVESKNKNIFVNAHLQLFFSRRWPHADRTAPLLLLFLRFRRVKSVNNIPYSYIRLHFMRLVIG